ncbi:MAG TPA: glycosyltransferase family 2 protein [Chthoniobacteraceae bacterium]|jgi:glycosyltransferase involved in cell wall biosynthesis|nr:glycosyltransferase family 2 protein [Chthoniobacteraceae bacterium]
MEYTVIIPTHNRPDLVVRAIRSVQSQTSPAREILVIDDASTPPLALPAEIAENRVRVIRHEQSVGGAAARNSGLDAASTDIIAFLDDDDEWMPEKMEVQLAWLASHPEASMVTCGHLRCEGGREYREVFTQKFVERYYQYDNFFGSFSYLVIRRSRSGAILDAGMPALQDWDFALRAVRGAGFGVIEQPLVKYYAHDLPRITNRRGNHLRGLRRCYLKHRPQLTRDARHWLLSRIVFERTREVTSISRRLARIIFSLRIAAGCRLPMRVKYRSMGRRAASLMVPAGTLAKMRSVLISATQSFSRGRSPLISMNQPT